MFDLGHRHDAEYVEIKSSLSLQMLMYYQGFYSLLFFCVSGGCIMNKSANYAFGNAILELLTLPIFLLWSVTELARVFLGYFGNIKERVPMISAFLLLTIFPQLVAVAFFTFLQDPIFPFDMAGGVIMLLFLMCELVVGKRSLDMLIQRQTAQFFRLCQEEELHRVCRPEDHNEATPSDHPTERSSNQPRESTAFNPLRQRRRLSAIRKHQNQDNEERRSLLANEQEAPTALSPLHAAPSPAPDSNKKFFNEEKKHDDE